MIPLMSTILGLVGLVLFIFWIMALIGAIQGKESPLPLIGDMAQSSMSFI